MESVSGDISVSVTDPDRETAPVGGEWFYEPDDDARDRLAIDTDADWDAAQSPDPDGYADPYVDPAGPTDPAPDTGVDPADAALLRARRGRTGLWSDPGSGGRRARSGASGTSGVRGRRRSSGPVTYSGSGADERDPTTLGELVTGMVEGRGWSRPLAEARVLSDWDALVGPDIAQRARPRSLTDGHLHLDAVSTAWATQLRLMTTSILGRLATEVGAGVVTRLSISGPTGPTWKHGPRAVPGARGPRDTYG